MGNSENGKRSFSFLMCETHDSCARRSAIPQRKLKEKWGKENLKRYVCMDKSKFVLFKTFTWFSSLVTETFPFPRASWRTCQAIGTRYCSLHCKFLLNKALKASLSFLCNTFVIKIFSISGIYWDDGDFGRFSLESSTPHFLRKSDVFPWQLNVKQVAKRMLQRTEGIWSH